MVSPNAGWRGGRSRRGSSASAKCCRAAWGEWLWDFVLGGVGEARRAAALVEQTSNDVGGGW